MQACVCMLYVQCCFSCTSLCWYLIVGICSWQQSVCLCVRLCVFVCHSHCRGVLFLLCMPTQKRRHSLDSNELWASYKQLVIHCVRLRKSVRVAWRWSKCEYLCVSRQHGEQWQKNACTTCVCDRGQSRCHTHTCRPVTCDKVGRLTHSLKFSFIQNSPPPHLALCWNSNGCRGV